MLQQQRNYTQDEIKVLKIFLPSYNEYYQIWLKYSKHDYLSLEKNK
jgi:hypothetical protein